MEGLTRPVTHIVRLLKWGRILARHGALRGIESAPQTPPGVKRLCRIARLGTIQPRVRQGAGASPMRAARQARAPALGPTSRVLAISCAQVHSEKRRSTLSSRALAKTPKSCPTQK